MAIALLAMPLLLIAEHHNLTVPLPVFPIPTALVQRRFVRMLLVQRQNLALLILIALTQFHSAKTLFVQRQNPVFPTAIVPVQCLTAVVTYARR